MASTFSPAISWSASRPPIRGRGYKSSTTNAFPAALVTPGATYSAKINWLTTITPRLGYAAGPWLAYVKGGLAAGEVDSTMTGALVPTIEVHEKNRQLGWTAGAGVEYAMSNRWVVGLEYNYYDLGSERFGGSARQAGVPTDYGDYNVGVKASSVLARVSYRGGILETVLSAAGPAADPGLELGRSLCRRARRRRLGHF